MPATRQQPIQWRNLCTPSAQAALQHHAMNVAAVGAQSHAQRHLPLMLRDQIRDHAEQADRRQQQRNAEKRQQDSMVKRRCASESETSVASVVLL